MATEAKRARGGGLAMGRFVLRKILYHTATRRSEPVYYGGMSVGIPRWFNDPARADHWTDRRTAGDVLLSLPPRARRGVRVVEA